MLQGSRGGAEAVSVELQGTAEAEECHGAWAAEAKEPCGAELLVWRFTGQGSWR